MRRGSYYNDTDPYVCQWLRNLIAAGLIAPGDVDERSITEVRADDIRRYTQCHFFAGIAGWSYALRLAGWPDDRPVWTGSCPCQPLSGAGQRRGHADERHLWPAFHRLIAECRPAVVFGEQVGGTLGLEWLSGVRADLEGSGYACGCASLPACGVGAPHIRSRLWFVADANSESEHGQPINGEVASLPQSVSDAGSAGLPLSQQGAVSGPQRRQEGRAAGQQGGWSVEPGVGRVAHGIPCRVGQLRAYGNAIVPQVAAAFIAAYMDL
jgi:DNA (cytosine-5)-methyltransferase 1